MCMYIYIDICVYQCLYIYILYIYIKSGSGTISTMDHHGSFVVPVTLQKKSPCLHDPSRPRSRPGKIVTPRRPQLEGPIRNKSEHHWIGLRENLNRKPRYLMVKTMVSGLDFPSIQ